MLGICTERRGYMLIPQVAEDWKYILPVGDVSAKPHVASLWAAYIDLPCDLNLSFPQVGTRGAELLYMETKLQMVFYDSSSWKVSVKGNIWT